jgi:superfamily II DNA/RNA helicase
MSSFRRGSKGNARETTPQKLLMTKFEELGFTPGILKAIQELGFEQPMPVQEKVIPLMLLEEGDISA